MFLVMVNDIAKMGSVILCFTRSSCAANAMGFTGIAGRGVRSGRRHRNQN